MPWLGHQLGALANQQFAAPWEVVVADNGSTDASLALVEEWSGRCRAIRWIDASAVRGPAAARNAGVRAASGDLLAFCDADDVVGPGWIESCAKALADSDAVGGVFDFWSLNGLPASPPIAAAMGQFGFLAAGLAANLAVHRRVFEDVGGFAEQLLVGEDIDLCWRLQLKGYLFKIAPNAVVAKRAQPGLSQVFRRALAYGRCGPVLYQRHRAAGARRDLAGAAKAWAWLLISSPRLVHPPRRADWVRVAGMRLGRLEGCLRLGVFFP